MFPNAVRHLRLITGLAVSAPAIATRSGPAAVASLGRCFQELRSADVEVAGAVVQCAEGTT